MIRTFSKILVSKPTIEGAGVRLKRGFEDISKDFDPFLLFDDFSGEHEEDYAAGFPGHPHRGMETVTYILEGTVRHRDSLGNEGFIGAGDIQWMNAGSGILHEEMPETRDVKEGIKGFQLWVNLPRAKKMLPPQYRDIKSSEVPVVARDGVIVRVLGGSYEGTTGPVAEVTVPVTYLDVSMESDRSFSCHAKYTDTLFVYVLEGALVCYAEDNKSEQWVSAGSVALTQKGNTLTVKTGTSHARFLMIAGTPLEEPVAWRGPIVMNTEEEIQTAFAELQNGTFVK